MYPPQSYQDSRSRSPPQQQQQAQVSSREVDFEPPQQGYYLSNDNAWTQLPAGYSLVRNSDAKPTPQRGYASDDALDAPQTLMPPPYPNQQQRQMDFGSPRDQSYEYQGERTPSPLPALAGKAMDYAMNNMGGKSGKSNSGGKGSELLSGLFAK